MKNMLKKLGAIFLLITLILGILPISKSEAVFTADDCPYDITFVKVRQGNRYTMAIDDEGYLWTWGNNQYGSLGIGTSDDVMVPTRVSSNQKFKEVYPGMFHTLAIDTSGNLWAWGCNWYGQLGDGTTEDSLVPIQVLTGKTIVEASVHTQASMAIDSSGNLWIFGMFPDGSSGMGSENWYIDEGTDAVLLKTNMEHIALGFYFAIGIDTSGNLWAWGNNQSGQLGNNRVGNATAALDSDIIQTVPIQITSGTKFVQVGAGFDSAIALDKDGKIWTWGGSTYIPTKVDEDKTFEKISMFMEHRAAIDTDGNLWTWGENGDGQLGIYGTTDRATPVQVKEGTKFIDVSAGNSNTVAIDEKYNTWICGSNSYGELGIGSTSSDETELIQIAGKTYTVTFNTNGGTIKSGEITKYTPGTPETLPTNVTKEGYTFAGWYPNASFLGNVVTEIPSTTTGDLTFYAKWTANTDTTYKIEHYKQNASLNGYTLADTDSKTGTTGAVAVALAKTYTGFTENTTHEERVATGNVAGDGSLVLKLYYDRNSYTVTLNKDGGTINSGEVTSYTYGIGATLPTDVSKTGYTFAGWYHNSSLTGTAVTSISTTETGDKTYYAKWTQNKFTVIFKNNEETVSTQSVEYGSSATAPELTKQGYTLSWDKAFSNITEDITVNAVWTPNANTAYRVEHYKQTVDKTGYEIVTEDTQNLTGTTDTTVTATAKTYEGFTENTIYSERVATGKIAGDGSLVLKIYYDRKTYDINIDLGGIEGDENPSYTYGEVVTLPTDLTKEGYTFGGWYDNPEFTGNNITQITINEETANKTYYIKWIPNVYTVTLNENGGTINSGKVTNYTYGVGATLPTNVTRTGYIFGGWYENSQFTGNKVTSITTTDIGNKEYFAKWTVNEDTIIDSGKYEIDEGYITKVSPNTSVDELLTNIGTNGTTKVFDTQGNEVTGDKLVGTGYIVEVEFDGTKYEYEIVVRGDIDGNGKITITDLSMLNQQIVRRITLTGAREKAADIDYSGKITVTDLSMLNQALVGRITL